MKKFSSALIISLLLLFVIVSSCSQDEEPTKEQPPGIALCGNGICDAHEQEKGSCPADCIKETEQQETAPTYVYDGKTPVYVTIYTHNEDSWNAFVGSEDRYKTYRENLVERLNIIDSYGAKLDWQADWVVLNAMTKYETEDLWNNTNGKPILKYMTEDLGFSADPHGHVIEYNYADLAHLYELNDMTPTGIIGGVAALDCVNGEIAYTNWRDVIQLEDDGYVYGDIYPDAKWKPTILTVPAMGGHFFDDFSSGVWIPGEVFTENDPSGDIVYVGQGYPHNQNGLGSTHASGAPITVKDGEYIKELVDKIHSGEVPSGKIYTASIHFQDLPQNKDGEETVDVNEGVKEILEELKPLADAGYIKYATYEEVVDVWKNEYNSEPNRLGLETFSMYNETLAIGQGHCQEKRK